MKANNKESFPTFLNKKRQFGTTAGKSSAQFKGRYPFRSPPVVMNSEQRLTKTKSEDRSGRNEVSLWGGLCLLVDKKLSDPGRSCHWVTAPPHSIGARWRGLHPWEGHQVLVSVWLSAGQAEITWYFWIKPKINLKLWSFFSSWFSLSEARTANLFSTTIKTRKKCLF